jgi:hypothetical protein
MQVMGNGGVWEVSWRQLGAAPAGESEARRLGTAMVELAEGAGLRVSLEPTLVLGGTVVDVGPVERLPAWDGAELTWRGRSVEGGVDAGRALEAARDLSERSVLELNRGLEEVLSLSQQQCTEVEGLARTFDTTGGLGVALTALEGELSTVGQRLSGVLSGHLVEVGSAAASAHDIVKLAAAVGQIAQSARMLTFNAKVESARLGAEGKGFVVIAGAISELANDVRTSNDLVTGMAEELVAKLPKLREATAELASATDAQLASLKGRLGSLRETFQTARDQAVTELGKAQGAAEAVKARSHEVIRHLQFQDRTSQLLMRVKAHVESMEAALGVKEAAASPDLLARVGTLGRKLEDQTIGMNAGEVTLF